MRGATPRTRAGAGFLDASTALTAARAPRPCADPSIRTIMMGDALNPVDLFGGGGQEAKGEQARMVCIACPLAWAARRVPWVPPCSRDSFFAVPPSLVATTAGLHCRCPFGGRPREDITGAQGHGQDPAVDEPGRQRVGDERRRDDPQISPHRCVPAAFPIPPLAVTPTPPSA